MTLSTNNNMNISVHQTGRISYNTSTQGQYDIISQLPQDISLSIFEKLKTDLSTLALVCKSWTNLTDNEGLLNKIRPLQVFGDKEWKEYLDADPGRELNLPRRAYGDLERNGGVLTLIPEKVRRINKNGDIEYVNISLEFIEELVKNPKKGNPAEYGIGSVIRDMFINIRRMPLKSHWVWINKKVIGRGKTYEQQIELVNRENKKISGANIPEILDTIVSVFTEIVRSGKCTFLEWDKEQIHVTVKATTYYCKSLGKIRESSDSIPLISLSKDGRRILMDGCSVEGINKQGCSFLDMAVARQFFEINNGGIHSSRDSISAELAAEIREFKPLINNGFIINNDLISQLPTKSSLCIFEMLKTDLPTVALVCKNWKALTDNDWLLKKIRPLQTFGENEWKEYIGADPGIEPHLPRRAYGDLEREGGMLTLIPRTVKVTKENGNVDEAPVDSLAVIAKWVKNSKTGKRTGFHPKTWLGLIDENRQPEKTHWTWINEKVIGMNKTYAQQLELIRNENGKGSGAHMSSLKDTVVSVFMQILKSGSCHFMDGVHLIVRDKSDNKLGTSLSLTPEGIMAEGFTITPKRNIIEDPSGVVVARKFF